MKKQNIFVTGGTGLIGRWTVAQLSQLGHRVRVLVRNAHQREEEYYDWIQAHKGNKENVELLDGDLSKTTLGLTEGNLSQLSNIDTIYHMGASFSWGLSPEQARQVTVDGSRELMHIASQLPKLKQLIHLSGYMLAAAPIWTKLGLDPKKQDATNPLSEQQISHLYKTYGGYEAAKIESHFLMQHLAHKNNIPLTGILLSSAIGHSQTGEIDQPHGIPMLVNSLWNENLPIIPGTKNDWIPLITVDYLVNFITGILQLPETINKNYVVLDEDTPSLAELLAILSLHIGNQAPTRFIPVKLVQFFLNLGLEKVLGSSAETLDFVKPYRFDTLPAKKIAQKLNIEKPNIRQAVLHMVDYLVHTDFGNTPNKVFNTEQKKNTLTTIGSFHSVANTQTFINGPRYNADYIFLHGMPFNSHSWASLRDKIEGSTMAADLPNVSNSKGSYQSRTTWMNSLLNDENGQENNPKTGQPYNKKQHLITHSLGTSFAVDYTSRYPQRVNSLVLISPYFLQGKAGVITRIPFIGSLLKVTLNKSRFSRMVVGDVTKQEAIDNAFSNTRRPGVFATIMSTLKQASQTKHRRTLQEKLSNIQVPTLIIYGSNDPLVEQVTDNPNIQVISIKGAGHNPHLSHEKDVLLAIRDLTSRDITSKHSIPETNAVSEAVELAV